VPATVLIVDDHAAFRSVARRLLQSVGYEVIGEAADGRSALEAAERLHPQLVLLDIQLPDADGCEVSRQLTATDDAPAVVLISSRSSTDYGPRILSCGARGFVEKNRLSAASLGSLFDPGD
jgi:DNA-binding NarL/FixJ family response regulator